MVLSFSRAVKCFIFRMLLLGKESLAGLIWWLIIVTWRAPSGAGAAALPFSCRLLMPFASDQLIRASKITESNNIITRFARNY